MNILHILNGDSTFHSFEQTGLEGDAVVWREVLSEGPLEENISSGSFWTARSEWIGKTFNETSENYQQNVLDPLSKLSEPYDEINFWFEFDLHCRVNLIGVMSYMKQKTDLSSPAVYLISPADYPGKENFMGMGELSGEELEDVYDNNRVQLGAIDFIIASEAWDIYVSHDAGKLRSWLEETDFWGNLPLLKPALEAHLKRLEVNQNGLNYIEQKLLDIYNDGVKTKPKSTSGFGAPKNIWPGDAEIDIYLNRLKEKGLITL